MALIKCPECNREVSERAKSCPQCAFPIDEFIKKQAEEQALTEKKEPDYAREEKPERKGTLDLPEGKKYEGEIKDDKPHGQGVLILPDGKKFIGGFKSGKADGYGTLFDKDGKKVREGEWKDGKWIKDDNVRDKRFKKYLSITNGIVLAGIVIIALITFFLIFNKNEHRDELANVIKESDGLEKSIAVTRTGEDGKGLDIYTMNIDGSGVIRLTDGSSPSWSPDGKKIAFERHYLQKDDLISDYIYVMNADGSNITRLTTEGARFPAWSPDGKKIVFKRNSYIYIMNADGSGATRVTEGNFPAWSPNGEKIIFQGYWDMDQMLKGIVDPDIFVINADGTGLTYIAKGRSPQWSPEGKKIVFISARDSDLNIFETDIYVMDANGSNITRLTYNGESCAPVWSPDGEKITFSKLFVDGGPYIYIMNADGTGGKLLTKGLSLSWNPMGEAYPIENYSAESKFDVPLDKLVSAKYKVQIGAFTKNYEGWESAYELSNKAEQAGFDPYIGERNDLYIVQIGFFEDRQNAENLKKEALDNGFEVFISTDPVGRVRNNHSVSNYNSSLEKLGLEKYKKDDVLAVVIIDPSEEEIEAILKLETHGSYDEDSPLLVVPVYNESIVRIKSHDWEWHDEISIEEELYYENNNTEDGYGLLIRTILPCGIPLEDIQIVANGIEGNLSLSYPATGDAKMVITVAKDAEGY